MPGPLHRLSARVDCLPRVKRTDYLVGQERHENRTVLETLDIGWRLLGMLPREELDRIDTKILDQFYKPAIE